MNTVTKRRSCNTDHARQDPALAMLSIFRPEHARNRPLGVKYQTEHQEGAININVWRGLDTCDQSLLLACIALAGIESAELHADVPGEKGKELWSQLEPNDEAQNDVTAVVKVVRYQLIREAGLSDAGQHYKTLIEESLERLSMVGFRVKTKNSEWSMRLISYTMKGDVIHIALNSRMAAAITGHHVRVSLDERRNLRGELAKTLHAWLSAWIRPGKTNRITLGKLAERTRHSTSTQSSDARRQSMKRLRVALEKISVLPGWTVTVKGRGEQALVRIHRPRIIDHDER